MGNPDQNTTMAELIKMIVTALNATTPGDNECESEDGGLWYAPYFQAARDLDIIRGECLDPNTVIDGESATLYINRAFETHYAGLPQSLPRKEIADLRGGALANEVGALFP